LASCASFSPDSGLGVASEVARRELGHDVAAIRSAEDASAASARVAELLRRPLTANAAVEIVLRSNHGLQAAYNRLGAAEAVKVRDSLPPNPSFAFGRIAGSLSS